MKEVDKMTRRKLNNPKTARTSLCFTEQELQYWREYCKENNFSSFSEFVRQAINLLIRENKNA